MKRANRFGNTPSALKYLDPIKNQMGNVTINVIILEIEEPAAESRGFIRKNQGEKSIIDTSPNIKYVLTNTKTLVKLPLFKKLLITIAVNNEVYKNPAET